MNTVIKTLLDGYDMPVFLSDADKGYILYINHVAEQKLGVTQKGIEGQRFKDLLKSDELVWNQRVFEHEDRSYLVQDERLKLSGQSFIKSSLKPFSDLGPLSYYRLQQEMAGRMVHRMRSPLTGMLGFTELLEKTSLNAHQQRYVDTIKRGLMDLEGILSRLKVLGDEVEVQNEPVDVTLMVQQVINELPDEWQQRTELTTAGDAASIQSSFIALKFIVEKMLDNAFEHGTPGNASVTIVIREDRIRIINTGKRIPDSLAPYIFYPFFSGKSDTMGLGLAKCAYYANELGMELRLAKNSDQSIWFEIIF